MDRHIIKRLLERIITMSEIIPIIVLTRSILFLPKTSAKTPDGISKIRLTIWNTVSAIPISTRLYPLAAKIATQAPVKDKLPRMDDVYNFDNCFLILNIKNLLNFIFSIMVKEIMRIFISFVKTSHLHLI